MSLKTRIDSHSEDNNSFVVKNSQGEVVAKITALHSGINLDIDTESGYFIEKPNGWNSKPKKD